MADESRLRAARAALSRVQRDLMTADCVLRVDVIDPCLPPEPGAVVQDPESWINPDDAADEAPVLLVMNRNVHSCDDARDEVALAVQFASCVQDGVIGLTGRPWPEVVLHGRSRVLDAMVSDGQAVWGVRGEPYREIGRLGEGSPCEREFDTVRRDGRGHGSIALARAPRAPSAGLIVHTDGRRPVGDGAGVDRLGGMYGYFGPEGTFTHQALLTLGLPDAQARPYPSVGTALDAVRAGEVEASVVPIENSVEGGVSATLDELGAPDAAPLHIIAEVVINVGFDLAVRPGVTELAAVHRVITHPHAAAQCRGWLHDHVPQAVVTERGSTAGAAKEVASPESPFDAAICAPVARDLYGLVALASDIGDRGDAVTRFALVARPGHTPARTGNDKTSFVAYMKADQPGALLEILEQLAVRGVNMCRIESRPTKTTLGSYCFSIDAEGHIDDARLSEALVGLRRICHDVVFLGSYPRADGQSSQVPPGGRDSDYARAHAWLESVR